MTRPSGRAAALLVILGGLACGDIAAPIRNDFYEWRIIVPFGATADTVSFHWTQADLPVRVWVAADEIEGLPALAERAIGIWEEGFLYGEFSARLVSDSGDAHVIVRGVAAPEVRLERVTRLGSSLAPECGGATDLDLSTDLSRLGLPIRVYLDPRGTPASPALSDCLALTTVHEMGHAIGIFTHSEDPADIMFADPVADLPSAADRETAELLYHSPITVEVAGP